MLFLLNGKGYSLLLRTAKLALQNGSISSLWTILVYPHFRVGTGQPGWVGFSVTPPKLETEQDMFPRSPLYPKRGKQIS